ncbi:hypothetical protein HDU98_007082 [Podochytrium sp. JEL0797]|nr:hypothetical protein HDU98_007082 [Podochytrium sp. JEL0797]
MAQKTPKTNGGVKKTRAPSAWSTYLKSNMAALKQANPGKDHKELMAILGASWKVSPDNPKKA